MKNFVTYLRTIFLIAGLIAVLDANAVKEYGYRDAVIDIQLTDSVYPGCTNIEMARLRIRGQCITCTGPAGGTWGVGQITVKNGATDFNDIANVKLWWDDGDGVFDATADELLGTDVSSPIGLTSVFDFPDKVGFKAETWYVWVTWDLKSSISCGTGNVYDVAILANDIILAAGEPNCTTVGGGDCEQPAANTSPAGERTMAACGLSPGDIAIIGMNTTDPDEFTFVALTDISSGVVIKFTDKGWKSDGTFYSTEGVLTWTATSLVACGTEVTIESGWTSTGGHTVVQSSGTFSLAMAGDQILAYQGSLKCHMFIAALDNSGSAGWDADATSAQTSAVPEGLGNGTTCIAVTPDVNVVYDCSTTSGAAAILTEVCKIANWTGSGATITLPVPCTFTCGGCTEPTVAPSNPTYGSITTTSFVLSWTTDGGPNYLVVVKSGSAVGGSPADNTTYADDPIFNNGQGTVAAGEFVVYDGALFTVTVTGLTCGTTYHVEIWSHDCVAGSEDYYLVASGVSSQATSACPAGDCFDNIQNGTETGVDCGGSCPACDCE